MLMDFFLNFFRTGKNWLTKLILGLLAITFAFGFGFSFTNFGGSGQGLPQGSIAQVNDEPLYLAEYNILKQSLYSRFSQAGAPEDYLQRFVSQRALDQLIEQKLLAQEALRLGFTVSDEELSESIETNPAFQFNGRFVGKDTYQSFIQNQLHQSVVVFEQRYREQLMVQRLFDFINLSAQKSDDEIANLYKIRNEKASLEFIEFSPDDVVSEYVPSEDEMSKYFAEHAGEFKTSELRKINYFVLDNDYFTNQVKVSEEELKAYYEAYKHEFAEETESGKDGDSGAQGTEEVKIAAYEDVRDKISDIMAGKRVAKLRESLKNKLDNMLGKKTLLQLAQENGVDSVKESVPFAAGDNLDEIPSRVIRTVYSLEDSAKIYVELKDGIWFIEISKIISPQVKPIEDVREEVVAGVNESRNTKVAENNANEALRMAVHDRIPLRKLAKSMNKELGETGFFTRIGKIGNINSDELRREAFNLSFEEPISPKVYQSDGSFYVASLREIQAVEENEYDQAKITLKDNEVGNLQNSLRTNLLRKLRSEAVINVDQTVFPRRG